jgi:hypothetical protein
MSNTHIRLVTRVALPLLISLGLLIAAPLAQASDASLRRAVKPYVSRLTADVSYLSNFAVPRKSGVVTVLRRLDKIRTDLGGATRAVKDNQGSTSAGRKGRTLALSALRHATTATADARACATAVRAGKRSAAKSDQRHEQTEINRAISQFEAAGKLLHLF